MSGSRFVDVDRFEGASSLTELFETDALLDAIGSRDASYAELLGRPGGRGESDRAIFLLRALTESVDASLAHLGDPLDPLDLLDPLDELPQVDGSAAVLRFVPRAAALSCAIETSAVDAQGGNAFRRLASRTVPRHLPRANRFVAAAAGAMIVLSGGGLAAAATTSPGHGWGPLAPLSRVLHPGWTVDSVAAKRAVVVRELQQAVDQSRSGQKVAATATYRVASRQAHDLPSGPDATLRAQMAAVAQQIGLTDDPTSVVMPPVDLTAPVTITLPGPPPSGGLATAPPSSDPGTVAAPTAGAAPGTLPPASPTDPSAPSGTEPGSGPVAGTGTGSEPEPEPEQRRAIPGHRPVRRPQAMGRRPRPTGRRRVLLPTRPPGRTLRPVPGPHLLDAPNGGTSADPTGPTVGSTDPTAGATDPAAGVTTPPATVSTTPPVADPTTPPTGVTAAHHHKGRHRAHHGVHRGSSTAPVNTSPAGTSSDPTAAPPAALR